MLYRNEKFELEERRSRDGKTYHRVCKQRCEYTELKLYNNDDIKTVVPIVSNEDNSVNQRGRMPIGALLLIIAIILAAAIITTFSPELWEYLRPLFEELFTHLNL